MHLHTPLGKSGVGSSNENKPRGLNDWCYQYRKGQIWPFWNRLLKTNSFSSTISSCFVELVNTFISVKEWVWVVIKLRFRTFSACLDTVCIGRQIYKKTFVSVILWFVTFLVYDMEGKEVGQKSYKVWHGL